LYRLTSLCNPDTVDCDLLLSPLSECVNSLIIDAQEQASMPKWLRDAVSHRNDERMGEKEFKEGC
jgi:hypothetical protein